MASDLSTTSQKRQLFLDRSSLKTLYYCSDRLEKRLAEVKDAITKREKKLEWDNNAELALRDGAYEKFLFR